MKSLKKFYITLASLMAGVIAVCSIPEISAKYQNIVPEDNAFEIKFPIDNIGKQAADALTESFLNVLLNPESYEDIIAGMGNGHGSNSRNWLYTYVGNVAGEDDDTDSQLIENLFGEDIVFEDQHVTIMIKRADRDNDVSTGEGRIDRASFLGYVYQEYELLGREMTLYTTAAPLGTSEVANGAEVEVYAMVFTYYNGGTINENDLSNTETGNWQFVGQYKGKATTNDYNTGDTGNNSFDTETWVSTEVYYNENGVEIAVGEDLNTLIQTEATAQKNLQTIKDGGTTTANA